MIGLKEGVTALSIWFLSSEGWLLFFTLSIFSITSWSVKSSRLLFFDVNIVLKSWYREAYFSAFRADASSCSAGAAWASADSELSYFYFFNECWFAFLVWSGCYTVFIVSLPSAICFFSPFLIILGYPIQRFLRVRSGLC